MVISRTSPCSSIIGLGDEADAAYVQAAVGLVWRVLLLMVGLLTLLTFAHWLGA